MTFILNSTHATELDEVEFAVGERSTAKLTRVAVLGLDGKPLSAEAKRCTLRVWTPARAAISVVVANAVTSFAVYPVLLQNRTLRAHHVTSDPGFVFLAERVKPLTWSQEDALVALASTRESTAAEAAFAAVELIRRIESARVR